MRNGALWKITRDLLPCLLSHDKTTVALDPQFTLFLMRQRFGDQPLKPFAILGFHGHSKMNFVGFSNKTVHAMHWRGVNTNKPPSSH